VTEPVAARAAELRSRTSRLREKLASGCPSRHVRGTQIAAPGAS
jgi:predicted nucleic acid-binding Zn ribbon protein